MDDHLPDEVISQLESLKNVDSLSEYSKDVADELEVEVNSTIQSYATEAESLLALYEESEQCTAILGEMSNVLEAFQTDLSLVTEDIHALHDQSVHIQRGLHNRALVVDALGELLDDVVIPLDLIESICNDKINEAYIARLKQLEMYSDVSRQHKMPGSDLDDTSRKLCLVAVRRTREYLLEQISKLTKPNTNIQIIQQTILQKYGSFFSFLAKYASPSSAACIVEPALDVAEEIKSVYGYVVMRLYKYYFSIYYSDLRQLKYPDSVLPKSNDVFASAPRASTSFDVDPGVMFSLNTPIESVQRLPASYSLFATATSSPSTSPSISAPFTREDLVQNLARHMLGTHNVAVDNSGESRVLRPVLCHIAKENRRMYRFEYLWWSICDVLGDAMCSEFYFQKKFFSMCNTAIFNDVLEMLLVTLRQHCESTYDPVEILFLYVICECQRSKLLRRFPDAAETLQDVWLFFKHVMLLLLDRFHVLFKASHSSLQAMKSNAGSVRDSTAPHFLTRRFSDFVNSLCVLIGLSPTLRQSKAVVQYVEPLRQDVTYVINSIPQQFSRAIDGTSFLVNQYNFILRAMHDRTLPGLRLSGESIASFEEMMNSNLYLYIELMMNEYFSELRSLSERISSESEIDMKEISEELSVISHSWNRTLDRCRGEILRSFADLQVSQTIIETILKNISSICKKVERDITEESDRKYVEDALKSLKSIRRNISSQ